jgi:single-strand DNA-binding protein
MNLIILMGRLTRDPELRVTASDNTKSVCRFAIAVDRPVKRGDDKPQADFFNLTAWNKTAEFVSKYFKKGVRILVQGELRNNNYEKDGKMVYGNDILVNRVYFADGKADGATFASVDSKTSQPEEEGFFPLSEDDDDLPF